VNVWYLGFGKKYTRKTREIHGKQTARRVFLADTFFGLLFNFEDEGDIFLRNLS
jgi:hypothetical protein